MSNPVERVKEIATDLIGCCGGSRPNLEAELDELGVGREAKPSAAFDEIVFVCDCCGWYCSIDEANDNGSGFDCDDCNKEKEE